MSQVDASSVSSPPPVELADVLDDTGVVDPDRFDRVEATLVGQGRWSDLAALYDAAVVRAPDPEVGRRYLLLGALLWAEKLESPRQAEPRLRRLLASDPEDPEALEALKDLCATSDRLLEAADLLDRATEVAPASDKPDLLLALAELAYPGLDDPLRALGALRYAYECDPSRVDVVAAARRVFVDERRWLDAKQVLDDQVETVVGANGGPGEVEGPTNGAITKTVSIVENGSSVDLSADEGPVADGDRKPSNGVVAASDPENNADDTVDMAGAPPDGEAGQAIKVVGELADGYLELALELIPHAIGHELAEECLKKARALGQGAALSRLDELAHLKQTWEPTAEQLRTAAFEARDKNEAADAYLRAAELVHVYGEDSVRADELVERCLLLVPGYGPALDFLETVHAAQDRLPDLARRLNAMVAAVRDPGAKVSILLREARLYEAMLSDDRAAQDARAAALTAYRRVLAIRPGSSGGRPAFERPSRRGW